LDAFWTRFGRILDASWTPFGRVCFTLPCTHKRPQNGALFASVDALCREGKLTHPLQVFVGALELAAARNLNKPHSVQIFERTTFAFLTREDSGRMVCRTNDDPTTPVSALTRVCDNYNPRSGNE
jgi:hypothetical protein